MSIMVLISIKWILIFLLIVNVVHHYKLNDYLEEHSHVTINDQWVYLSSASLSVDVKILVNASQPNYALQICSINWTHWRSSSWPSDKSDDMIMALFSSNKLDYKLISDTLLCKILLLYNLKYGLHLLLRWVMIWNFTLSYTVDVWHWLH
jgi:hypothetical protein